MNILQVTPRYPPHTGGVETHVAELSERMAARGHDVTVLTADAGSDVARRETRNGVTVRRFRGFSLGGAFHVAPGITRGVRQADADVVHAHNYHSLPMLFAALGAGDSRFVVTAHYHGGSADGFRDHLLALYRPLGGRVLRQADEVISVSEWEHEQLSRDFDVDATMIPNGLRIDRFAGAEPVERDRPYLLCVGRLEEYKGVQYAIRALAYLPKYDLVVAGSGGYRTALEEIAESNGVTERVEFLGYASDDVLPGLYAGAEVYLSLSEFESYGMTVGEALAAGTPCVVREARALVDWTNRTGCIGVADVDPRAVSRAVQDVADRNPAIEQQPSWDDVTERVLACYE